MGYSSPKKQLDLKAFLSEPAKRRPGNKGYNFHRSAAPKAALDTDEDAPEAPQDAGSPSDEKENKT
ncbi:hypothetical protein [Thioclava sp. GXIMD4215]|uniref:hypothetical protein n=1 Tax=Thioclava sp. GXIMD4215 TaxID=3131928 RepID=UPI00311AEC5A